MYLGRYCTNWPTEFLIDLLMTLSFLLKAYNLLILYCWIRKNIYVASGIDVVPKG